MSTILAVLSGLFTAYDGLSPDLTVFRGEPVEQPDGDFLTVGWAPNLTPIAGRLSFATEENVPPRIEDYPIPCYVETLTGDTDDASILARQQRLLAYWDQIQALHLANRNIGVSLGQGYVELDSFAFTLDESPLGFVIGVAFDVAVHAFI